MRTARGFTLVEIIVSIAIFLVASTVMLGALFGATDVFRRGEAARQAGDEATAVLATLQEDLSRAVPVRLREGKPAREWGRVYSQVGQAGNCLLALVIENPDRAQVRWVPNETAPDRKLVGMRKRVVWRVIPGSDPDATAADDLLVREEWDITANGQVISNDPANGYPGVAWPTDDNAIPLREDIITRGVLHFGVWIELPQLHRLIEADPAGNGPVIGWESTSAAVLPFTGETFDSNVLETRASPPFYPQPDAIRISLVLTGGGRYAVRGSLAGPIQGDSARIAGIKTLPTVAGSVLRIGSEWVRYTDFRGNRVNGLLRGQLRSAESNHASGTVVLAGQAFSLVAALPR
jgi:prepilin-type N-terminal cleavage/methylation domain-containing protein